jgi:hypothetical protein
VFSFQRATEGVESAVYKKMIAPFKNDLPISHADGFRRVCAEHKYAYFGATVLVKYFQWNLSCRLVPIPKTSYPEPVAFIIPKNSPYKRLINWR